MIEAYAIGVAATLEDGVTPPLLRIIDSLMKANTLMLDFAENVRRMSRAGLSLSGSLGKAAEALDRTGRQQRRIDARQLRAGHHGRIKRRPRAQSRCGAHRRRRHAADRGRWWRWWRIVQIVAQQ